jgi:ribosomal protein S8
MIYILSIFLSFAAYSQTAVRAIFEDKVLSAQSMARTAFIRSYQSNDRDKAVRATGVILKGGYLITNEHVIRPHFKKEKVAFHVYTNGKKFHKFQNMYLLGCSTEHDICLLKTKNDYDDAYFSLDSPSFRKITHSTPLGLYKEEELFFNGFCSGWPKMSKAKYVDYVTNGYQYSSNENRKSDTPSLQFSAPNGDSIACHGDSGGPLFDKYLHLYGIVRDYQNATSDPKKARNYAAPMDVIREIYEKYKDVEPTDQLLTISDFGELDTIFAKK